MKQHPEWRSGSAPCIKVRLHGQQLGRTTLYNKVVRHKTCHGHVKSCCATNVHASTIFFYKFGATATWKMMKICSNYVRQHTTSFWDHYIARISFEVDWHLTVHDLDRTIWSYNLKCRTTHVTPNIYTTTTRFMSHNHVVPSRTTKFLSVWTHL